MLIGILKEPAGENRVALLPEHLKQLDKLKIELLVEQNAGQNAFASDAVYQKLGATVASRKTVLEKAKLIIGINPPTLAEMETLKPDQAVIGVFSPLNNTELVKSLKNKKITTFSLDLIPRITRGQDKDILSSMATVAGYRAVLDAAMHLPSFFPMFMTAAGTIRPAKVLILGAGVAGLQAIATARKLGAQVEAFDVRAAVKEQVMSLGAKFVEVEGAKDDAAAGGYAVEQTEEFKRKQQQVIQEHAAAATVIICTAQIPGKKAPVLIQKETVEKMPKGSVIVDLAASSGGNCELTQNDKTIQVHGVTIIGQSNYPSTMPSDASKMYGNNVINLLKLMADKESGDLVLDWNDEIIKQTCLTHQGEIMNDRVKSILEK